MKLSRINDCKIMFNYLVQTIGPSETAKGLLLSRDTVFKMLSDGIDGISETTAKRIRNQFMTMVVDDKMEELRKPSNLTVKNYDNDDLTDLKAGTSRHGVNRGHGSFARSNNGI